MKCQSCEQDKEKLKMKKSEIVPSLSIKICASCDFDDFEPRWVIVLGARSGADMDTIKRFVSKRLYFGKDIKLEEVLA